MEKIEIKSIRGNILFSRECENNSMKLTVEAANISCVPLIYADLSGADLGGADLRGADLRDADLRGVMYNETTAFFLPQCPSEGGFIAWKKAGDKIIKIKVTEDAKRSSATTLKCRCSKAEVLEIQNFDGSQSGLTEIPSDHDKNFRYKVGAVASVENFDENRWEECSSGIHFFISREMAVAYK